MSSHQYRVVYRREGKVADQHRIFGLLPAANRFINQKLLRRTDDLAPLVVLRVEARLVGPWKPFADLQKHL